LVRRESQTLTTHNTTGYSKVIPNHRCQLLVAAPAAAPITATTAASQRNLRLDSPQPMPGGDPSRDKREWGGDSSTEPKNPSPDPPCALLFVCPLLLSAPPQEEDNRCDSTSVGRRGVTVGWHRGRVRLAATVRGCTLVAVG